jgi:RNA polymerase sigma-70 factor (ECF subfamily)
MTLEALRRGDHDAFKKIYLHYADSVCHFLKLLMHSEEDAKEITQEIFVQLWEKREHVDPTKSIQGYLYTIARNTAMNFFEHKKVHDKYMMYARYSQEESSGTSDESLIAEETTLLIEMAINRMPKQRRKVFLMSYEDGMSTEEIARQLNISRNTVDSHLATAKKELKGTLA